MKVLLVALGLAVAGSSYAQHHPLGEVNTEKPEGQLLQQIGQEADAAKKLALLEQFVTQYSSHNAVGWAYEQMLAAYTTAGQPDKAIAVGEKLIAMDPADAGSAQQTLKAAEAKKDPDLILKWAVAAGDAARKVEAVPKPSDADEADTWKRRVDYARQVEAYSEYALYAASLQNTDPQKRIALLEALEQRNPKSEYLLKAAGPWFLAYRQAGQEDKAVALAEKVVATDASDEDMLLVLADHAMKAKDPDKVYDYSAKLVELMGGKQKPASMNDADWANRKSTFLGLAHYMSGKQYFLQNKFGPADKELREALPMVSANAQLKPEVLFLLGLANYKMEKAQEAANFNRECAAIQSPFQRQAAKNLAAIKSQYRGVK